ncbi:MAG TPA: hypothetical protein PKY56_05930 [Candidatus Kapabacteria bacterium]|nr:hypothetical protein [Candidatus Kapabacteria bacterium]HPO63821.1 hypothetical protein [Candidatus Kapabacteria bacterium]
MLVSLKKSAISLLLLVFVFSAASCSKKAEEPSPEPQKEVAKEATSYLNEENLKLISNSIDYIEYFTALKEVKLKNPERLVATAAQYDNTTSKQKQIIRFGMLWTDIMFLKIVSSKVQIPDYTKVFERYTKELNAAAYFQDAFGDYLNISSSKTLDEQFYSEIKTKFRKDIANFINKAKQADEEFLVYFSLGVEIELLYMTSAINPSMISVPKKDTSKIHNIHKYLVDNTKTANELFQKFSEKQAEFLVLQGYKDYALKLKPVFEKRMTLFGTKDHSVNNIEFEAILSILNEVRNDILK